MDFPEGFYLSEIRDGFYVSAMMKRNWAAQMEVLAEVDRVCRLHNIKYYINSGTLLGAYRHKGFIPWDDDMDIIMFREDYDRFYKTASKDLSPEMHAVNCETYPRYIEMHGRVVSSVSVPIEKTSMEKFHGFGLPAGVDVFPYDYVPDSPEEQDKFFLKYAPIEVLILMLEKIWDDKDRLKEEFKDAEEVIGYKLPKVDDYEKQLKLLQKIYLDIVRKNVGKNYHHATAVNFWANHKHYGVEDISWYKEQVYLDFENMKLPANNGMEHTMTEWFGPNYMQPKKYGSHKYPYFFKMMPEEVHAHPYIDKHIYSVPRDEWIDRQKVTGLKFIDCLRNKCSSLNKIRAVAFNCIEDGKFDEALMLLEKMQNAAIGMGTIIEDRYKSAAENDPEKIYALSIVSVLEGYCEKIYGISNGNPECLEGLISLEQQLNHMLDEFSPKRKQVVFLPDMAANWESMEPAYRSAMANPENEVRVVPIPYYLRGRDGKLLNELVYDGDKFPANTEITDYSDFVFDNPCCDVIVTMSAYDDMDDGYSVHPFFYSDKLQTYSPEVIYIPWFKIDEIGENDPGRQIAVFFANIPGVVRADKVILNSENMKGVYLEALGQILNECNVEKMKDKLIVCEKEKLFS